MSEYAGVYESALVQKAISEIQRGRGLSRSVAEDLSSFLYDSGMHYARTAIERLGRRAAVALQDGAEYEDPVESILDIYIAQLVAAQVNAGYEDWKRKSDMLVPFLRELKAAMKKGTKSGYAH